jgi:hypothetical protein
MNDDSKAPSGSATSTALTERPGEAPRVLHFDQPEELRLWLDFLRANVLDLVAAGEDATRPLKKRFFSRAEARRRIHDAEQSLLALLDTAERGMPSNATEPKETIA